MISTPCLAPIYHFDRTSNNTSLHMRQRSLVPNKTKSPVFVIPPYKLETRLPIYIFHLLNSNPVSYCVQYSFKPKKYRPSVNSARIRPLPRGSSVRAPDPTAPMDPLQKTHSPLLIFQSAFHIANHKTAAPITEN